MHVCQAAQVIAGGAPMLQAEAKQVVKDTPSQYHNMASWGNRSIGVKST